MLLLFLKQIAESDPTARHLDIQDQAGFHLKEVDPHIPSCLGFISLPPCSTELNPVEKLGDLVKDAILKELEPFRHNGTRVAQLIGHGWLLDQATAGALT